MLNNLEKQPEGEYDVRTLARQQKVVGFSGEFCMMFELNEPIDGLEVIPMGYWLLPHAEELHTDYDNYGDITIDPIAEFWVVNQVVYWTYDAIVGTVVYEAHGGLFGGY
tara:strand:+ start:159 stop:485 length:327 start_codon:yes stop_codon:yes gene_type:complete